MKINNITRKLDEVKKNAKDVLAWVDCSEKTKRHPPYLETPYNLTQKKYKCPICEGREPIVAYIIRFYIGPVLKKGQPFNYFDVPGAYTTIEEAKKEVMQAFTTIKQSQNGASSGKGLIIEDDITPACDCNCVMATPSDNGVVLIGKMHGSFPGGEFFIEIIKA